MKTAMKHAAVAALVLCCQAANAAELPHAQDVIRVDGNRFVDESGATFVFRGVSIADPAKLLRDDQWSKRIFAAVRSWGANTVRLPVHPRAWRELGEERYLQLIDLLGL